MSRGTTDFRQLFAEEAEGRLARLGRQLLELEVTGNDPELVASVFREAHTLKGAAAVVGFDDVATVAHALEELLEGVRSGAVSPSASLVDIALAGVDSLTGMVPRLLAGEDCSGDAAAIELRLRNWSPGDAGAEPPAAAGSIVVPEPQPAARADADAVSVPISRLDELVRLVGESAAANLRVGSLFRDRLEVDPATVPELRDLARILRELQERTMRTRMVPVSTITDQLQRAVRDLSRSLGKQVRWEVRGDDTELDRGVLQHLADPLLHLIRNAIDHGIESPAERLADDKDEWATVRLHAMQLGSEVIITVADDGRGIDLARVRERAAQEGHAVRDLSDDDALFLIFRSGLSTAETVTDISGRGVGLDVVRAAVDAARGRIEVRSEPGAGTEFRVIVPITLAVLPCLLVAAGGRQYALPMHSVTLIQGHHSDRAAHAGGRPLVWVGETAVPVTDLQEALGLGRAGTDAGPVLVVAGPTRRHAFRVDSLVGQRDVVIKGLGGVLPRVDLLVGASVEPDGSILLVLDGPGLIERARLDDLPAGVLAHSPDELPAGIARHTVLVVDDALTVRELQRSILERAGYAVQVASDGVEALAVLDRQPCELVLTDVEMPRMDGIALVTAIRARPDLANLPVIMLTSRASEADRQRGLDAGADGYIIKSAFDETGLLAAVERMLGTAP